MELAIDTSTDFASIAISQEGEPIAEMTWQSRQNHTVELVPNIRRLLNHAKLEIKSLDAIFVAKGPGSFNGLRVGVSTAKGLAFALSVPLVGVTTLEIEAYPFAFTRLPIYPIHNAGRGEIATALYQQNNDWHCIEPEHLSTVGMFCQSVKNTVLYCGEIPPLVIEELQKNLGKKAVIPGAAARLRHASYLATLGWRYLKSGAKDDPASFQPIYLRQPPITQRKEKPLKK